MPFPSEFDTYLFHEGTLFESYKVFGAHLCRENGSYGVRFTVWAPNAREVRVVGDFNHWDGSSHLMSERNGIWSIFVPGAKTRQLYKFEIHTSEGEVFLKSDPYAFCSELRPGTASRICLLDNYEWTDEEWHRLKSDRVPYHQPMNIYEVHLGSWKRNDHGEYLSYRELARRLIPYVREMGYTHIELLPLAEHPYDRSWGYQATGYYSVTSRYGSPYDFMYFVDCCHQAGIGVILDWVPGHFCKDQHGLHRFDGTFLYEYEDARKRENLHWGTANFDLSKPEVRSFLISNALFWHEVYHVDGLRVDAVANILYLDFEKPAHQWTANVDGGRENYEGVQFLRELNKAVFQRFPNTLMIAEDSTAWPLVTQPTYLGGLGFNFKWNMGWMNDTLRYMQKDPIYRKWEHNLLTFSLVYAFSENYVLPLSHDEVVHGKKSLIDKMPGDYWHKFANLRVFIGYLMTHPGKKLLFMGGEIAQFDEWNDLESIEWHLLGFDMHRRFKAYMKGLNSFYLKERALWELDHSPEGFQWINPDDRDNSVISFVRRARSPDDFLVILCNFTPVERQNYRIWVPKGGRYLEVFNSDDVRYGGKGKVKTGAVQTGDNDSVIAVNLPPLALVVFRLSEELRKEVKECGGRFDGIPVSEKGDCGHTSGWGAGKQTGTPDKEVGQTCGSFRRKV